MKDHQVASHARESNGICSRLNAGDRAKAADRNHVLSQSRERSA